MEQPAENVEKIGSRFVLFCFSSLKKKNKTKRNQPDFKFFALEGNIIFFFFGGGGLMICPRPN